MELGDGYDLRYKEGANREEALLAAFMTASLPPPVNNGNSEGEGCFPAELSALRQAFVLATALTRGDFRAASAEGQQSGGTTATVEFVPGYDVHAPGIRVQVQHTPPLPSGGRGGGAGRGAKVAHPQLKAILAADRPTANKIQITYHALSLTPQERQGFDLLSDELEHHLSQCWWSGGLCQIASLLHVFEEHLERLQDPDFQAFFTGILFRPGLLLERLHAEPGVVVQLVAFCKSGLACFSGRKRLSKSWPVVNPGLLFFLRLAQQMASFIQHAAGSNPHLRPYKRRVASLSTEVATRLEEAARHVDRPDSAGTPAWMLGALEMLWLTQLEPDLRCSPGSLEPSREAGLVEKALVQTLRSASHTGTGGGWRGELSRAAQGCSRLATRHVEHFFRNAGDGDRRKTLAVLVAKVGCRPEGTRIESSIGVEGGVYSGSCFLEESPPKAWKGVQLRGSQYYIDLSTGAVQRDISTRKLLPDSIALSRTYREIFGGGQGEGRILAWAGPMDTSFFLHHLGHEMRILPSEAGTSGHSGEPRVQLRYRGVWLELTERHRGGESAVSILRQFNAFLTPL